MELHSGLIVRSQSGFFWVQTQQGLIVSQLRGRLKKGARRGDIAAIGDRVQIQLLPDGMGVIETIEPRQRCLSRLAPNPHGEYEQIIIANPDQAVLVFSCTQPEPHLGMLDRYLVICEKHNIPAVILVNKIDLLTPEEITEKFAPYPSLGYPLLTVSAKSHIGLEQLRLQLSGKISVFTGPSGVGKSTLLNALFPGWDLRSAEVRHHTHKGKHTTVVREMIPLPEGGYVADTPGLKALALWDIEPEELDGYFPEIRPLVQQCSFSDCTHIQEPGCAVRQAVDQGKIHPSRYQSYINMRSGMEENDN